MSQNKGFTLIELLVVIAIIGILAAAALASLGSARTKGQAAAVKSQMSSMRAQAELYFSGNNNSYGPGIFSTYQGCVVSGAVVAGTNTLFSTPGSNTVSPGLTDLLLGASNSGATLFTCHSSNTAWAVSALLPGGSAYCVDSTGRSTDTALNGNLYTTISSDTSATIGAAASFCN